MYLLNLCFCKMQQEQPMAIRSKARKCGVKTSLLMSLRNTKDEQVTLPTILQPVTA